ncbi:MAG: RNA polymerase subunit sigma-70, partial [Gammaproteobacteria bacterium]|nr:RNA polymerase subunit sigma-70 [Gammaproteobacteria bacterium]
SLAREPEASELVKALDISLGDLSDIEAAIQRGYEEGGFKVWDISNKANPRLLSYQRTYGFGVHRFDMDERYAYISTEMPGYIGNILVIYDLLNPEKPEEVSRWWMPGQHLAGGETPTWEGYGHRLHHALRFGDELWASVWHAGFRVIDISDITRPRTRASHTYHPWVVEPTHTVLPATQSFNGRRIAVVGDEEHDHRHGQPHAGLWLFDITDLDAITPLSTFHVSEMDSPWSRAPGRFGMHQFRERVDDHLVYCAWFSGGLRIVDISEPSRPSEAGFYIPNPVNGEPSPQSNDVDVDDRGLVYLLDRNIGLDIIQFNPHS